MKTDSQDRCLFPVGMFNSFFAGFMLLLFVHTPGICHAGEVSGAKTAGDDKLIYMMEMDALKLNGRVSKVRNWNEHDKSWLTGDYFEPVVLTIDVKNYGGECFGKHDFYVKKGIDFHKAVPGSLVMFHINRNMCHPNNALIIMSLSVLEQKSGR